MRTCHYENHTKLREHLAVFLNAYNFAKRLKALSSLTPDQHIYLCFQNEALAIYDQPPIKHSLGLNI